MKNRTTKAMMIGLLVAGGFFFAIPHNAEAATYQTKTEWRQALQAKLQRKNTTRKQRVLRERMSGGISFERYTGSAVSEAKQKEVLDERRTEARQRLFAQILGVKREARKALVARQRANGTYHYEYEVAMD